MDDLLKDIFGNDSDDKKPEAAEPIFEGSEAPVIKDDVVSEVYEAEKPTEEADAEPITEMLKKDVAEPVAKAEPVKEAEPVIPTPAQQPQPQQMPNTAYAPAGQQSAPVQNGGYIPPSDKAVFYQPPVQQPYANNYTNNFDIPPEFNQNVNRQYAVPDVQAPQINPMPPQKKKSGNTARVIIAIIAIIAIAIAFVGIGYAVKTNSSSSSNSKSDIFSDFGKDEDEKSSDNADDAEAEIKSSGEAAKKKANGDLTVAGVVEQTKSSCVGITVYAKQDQFSYFYDFGTEGNETGEDVKSGEGSGVIMSESSGKTYIMTCAHVIADGTRYTVTLDDDTEYEARYVGSDAQTDIGVLVIDAKGLNIAEFGDSKDIEIGEDCVVIGCPGGLDFKNSVTKGIVSALDVPIASTIGYNNECIQVDAAINPGNSGGALFNMQGQVIGINSSKIASTEYEGMGFAVPSNTAVKTANSLIKNGYVKGRAKLGITYATFSMLQNGGSQILAALEEKGFKDAQGTMIINEVNDDSDLKGKVEKNDMIVAVNGETMTSVDVMTSLLSKSKPGDTVTLTIARIEGNNIKTFEVKCKLVEAKE